MIFKEFFLIVLMFIISNQLSSLWCSLTIIPMSILLVMSFSPSISSGLIPFLFILVFIGGLMVLITSVASAVNQEQISNLSISLTFVSFIFLAFYYLTESSLLKEWSQYQLNFLLLFSETWFPFIFIVLLILILSLILMSVLLMEFKGMVRSA